MSAGTARVKPGDVLAKKYRVERVLGVGGMGVVVAAKHVDLSQRVALKFMLKESLVDPSHAERFLREARSAVQLKSAHTARVLDVGRLENGEPFMVMEYLEGHDLDEVLRRSGPLPSQTAVDYILQASEALAEAHGLGMVHRDVKPKNMFLTSTVDGRPCVKVLDFGLAKQLGAHGDVSLTATNTVFGSPQYMSPEQMRSAKDVDARSDVWSLGVCLYELVTGRVPFDAGGVAEICAMVLKDPVPPPSSLVPTIPRELEAVIVKCLEKDPGARFQSIADLAFALEPFAVADGAAQRILSVMQTAQRSAPDIPTIVNVDASSPDGVAKTLSAWDSGEQGKSTSATRSSAIIAVAAVGAIAVIVFAISVGMWLKSRRDRQPVQAAASSEVLPPPALPLPAPVVSGAAPTVATATVPPATAAADEAPATTTSESAPAHTATTHRAGPAKPARPSRPSRPPAQKPPAPTPPTPPKPGPAPNDPGSKW